ncbi:MAG: pilin [Candidatus Gracilibacteria bacterium]|nr:pilin [Candidatus Gracilibacteria bacterium]
MKNFIKIITFCFIFSLSIGSAFGDISTRDNKYKGYESENSPTIVTDNSAGGKESSGNTGGSGKDDNSGRQDNTQGTKREIKPLEKMKSGFHTVQEEVTGTGGIYNFLITVAKDMKNLVYIISSIYLLIMVLRLVFTQNSEEEFQNVKKTVIWTSVGLIVMQIAYSVAVNLYKPGVGENAGQVDGQLGEVLLINIINPIAQFMLFLTGFGFVAMMVYSAYRLITARGQEDKVKKGKDGVIYAIMGYVMVKVSGAMIKSLYGDINCGKEGGCRGKVNFKEGVDIVTDIINWGNTFMLVIVTIIIIYAGGLMVTSGGNEENMEKGKKWLLYALIGMFIVSASYTITVFFLSSEVGPVIKPPT